MKLSAWHKSHGDSVEFANPMFGRYDRVYMSKVFTFTADCADYYPCEIVRAGTGYKDYTTTLPDEIEHICPDYSLYSVNEAFGFLTRGCPNGCPWCIVPHKEGSIRPASPLREFLGDKRRAILLDNNVLASDFGLEQIERKKMIHIDLFSGIGGFALAAHWAGWRTLVTCEIDSFCRQILQYHFPKAYHHDDIHTLTYETIDVELSKRYGTLWRN